jgi:hypothetical protein
MKEGFRFATLSRQDCQRPRGRSWLASKRKKDALSSWLTIIMAGNSNNLGQKSQGPSATKINFRYFPTIR